MFLEKPYYIGLLEQAGLSKPCYHAIKEICSLQIRGVPLSEKKQPLATGGMV
jgi:hypothetical protein